MTHFKNKFVLPFAVSSLCLMMAACGGGSNNIDEDPTLKPTETTAVGCTVAGSDACFEFTMEYPVAGLQYTCSSDNLNIFSTKVNGNTVTGGCDKGDTATFFLNATDDYRVEMGSVKMSDLGAVSADSIPVHLTVLDMAKGITGQAATSLSESDTTVKVAMSLIKIFQAAGNQRSESNVIGDIQLLELDDASLVGLSSITADVTATELQDGSYANILKPWVDVGQVTDAQAFAVLKDAANLSLGALYQADTPAFVQVVEGLIGYTGSGSNRRALLGTFYLQSDRQGFTQGYGLQWRGSLAASSSSSADVAEAVKFMTTVDPLRMYASAQRDFIDPISKHLATKERFRLITSNNETMTLNQGKLLNDYIVPGTAALYEYTTGKDAVQSELAKWTQDTNEGLYSGAVDFVKAYPIAYLDRRVFASSKNVDAGSDYYFPLYATLTFSSTDSTVEDIQLGIMIDEKGDIRTDIKANATATDMSGMCGTADATEANPEDNYGVTQYRIGTVTATNYQPTQNDKTISPRMIIAGAQFGVLDGVLLGISGAALDDGTTAVNNLGLKMNLYNLLEMDSTSTAALPNINITAYDDTPAQWVNVYNQHKSVYLTAQKDTHTATAAEVEQQKWITGSLSVKLAPCYQIKKKAS